MHRRGRTRDLGWESRPLAWGGKQTRLGVEGKTRDWEWKADSWLRDESRHMTWSKEQTVGLGIKADCCLKHESRPWPQE